MPAGSLARVARYTIAGRSRLREGTLPRDRCHRGRVGHALCGGRTGYGRSRPLLEQTFSEPIDEASDIDRRYARTTARPSTRTAAPRPSLARTRAAAGPSSP